MTASVTVRMYNVGFGDCFIIRFPQGGNGRDRVVLIDCGVHTAGKGPIPLSDIVEIVVADLAEMSPKPLIDVVVATHRHRDHVEGFDHPAWTGVTVGEVWMPWTEDPYDAVARSLLARQSGRAKNLVGLAGDDPAGRWRKIRDLADNSLKNPNAMAMLHHGFDGNPPRFFLPERDDGNGTEPRRIGSFKTSVLPGVLVHVLGPSRNEKTIRDMDPPSGATYLRAGAGGDRLAAGGDNLPFDSFNIDQKTFRTRHPHLALKNLGSIVTAGRTDPLAAAAALDQSVNGTSLMLAFEYRGIVLLFPGDAQWGTWKDALDDPVRHTILTRTDLYKVGHHGSHNATPRQFVEKCLNHAQAALVPVAPTNIATFDDIPRGPLLAAIADHADMILRSDKPPSDPPRRVVVGPDNAWIELKVTARPRQD